MWSTPEPEKLVAFAMRRCSSTAVAEDILATLTPEYSSYLTRNAYSKSEFDVYEHVHTLFRVEAEPIEMLNLLMMHKYVELSPAGNNRYVASMNLRTLTEMARKKIYHESDECYAFVPYLKEISPTIAECVISPPKDVQFNGMKPSLSNAKTESGRRVILLNYLTPQMVNSLNPLPFLELIKHAYYTFEFEGGSRTFTHQFVRHRPASYSQESQRFSSATREGMVFPDSVAKNSSAQEIALHAVKASYEAFELLIASGITKEDARFFLPGGLKTKILATMSARQLMHMAFYRSDYSDIGGKAQWEIRDMADKAYAAALEKDNLQEENQLPRHIEEINF